MSQQEKGGCGTLPEQILSIDFELCAVGNREPASVFHVPQSKDPTSTPNERCEWWHAVRHFAMPYPPRIHVQVQEGRA